VPLAGGVVVAGVVTVVVPVAAVPLVVDVLGAALPLTVPEFSLTPVPVDAVAVVVVFAPALALALALAVALAVAVAVDFALAVAVAVELAVAPAPVVVPVPPLPAAAVPLAPPVAPPVVPLPPADAVLLDWQLVVVQVLLPPVRALLPVAVAKLDAELLPSVTAPCVSDTVAAKASNDAPSQPREISPVCFLMRLTLLPNMKVAPKASTARPPNA